MHKTQPQKINLFFFIIFLVDITPTLSSTSRTNTHEFKIRPATVSHCQIFIERRVQLRQK